MLPPYRLREERTRRRDLRTARCGIVISTFLAGTIVAFAHPPTVAAQATCSSTEAIACGEVKAGSISTVGQTDCFEFSANAGEVVTLLAKAAGSTIQACAQLRDPSGNVVDGDACGQLITITIPATGAYTIRLFDRSNDQTGSYKLQLQVVSSTTSSCPVATLPCGSTPGGSLGSVVQSDTYRFSSTGPGEVVSITVADATAPFEACWQLYDGDGIALGTLECGEDTRTLPTAGPYTVRVFDLANDDTGTYRLDVTIVSATATSCRDATLACGAPHAGTISALADNDVYWFTTSFPNEVVGITTATTSGTMNACWQLYDFAGTSSGNIICGHDERVIATPGTYVLRVFDLTYDGAGTYDVSAMTQPACIATPTPTPTVTATATPSSGPTPGGVETATPSSNGSDATATPSGSGSPGSTPGGVPTSDGSATPTATGAGAATPTAATPTPLSTPSVQALEAILDDFLCYATKLTRGGPPFIPSLDVPLNDSFETMRFNVRKPTALCAPADRNGDGIAHPLTNLERYRIQRVRGAARYVRSTRRVVTSLGTISLDTIRPDGLLVPTAVSAVASPTVLTATAQPVDHYKCYKVRVTRKTPKLPLELQVSATDLLSGGHTRRLKVKPPTRLCVPIDANGEGMKNPAGNLLCYAVKPIRGEPKHVKQLGLHLANEVGTTRLDTLRESELCLPGLLVP